MTGVALLGCGFVADFYRQTLPLHPELTLVGVHDRERARAEEMARLTGARAYPSLEALLEDDSVSLVLNLTNPRAHAMTTRALLEAGKHVYSEKPLAMEMDEARALVALARDKGLALSCAPCTLLSPSAQTLWRGLLDGRAGPARLAYAEMDDGMVARAPTSKWINANGAVWPAVDEFEIGCTVEHAGYALSWLCAFFGPAETLTAFSAEIQPDKIPDLRIAPAADLSVACIRFRSGVVARMTNGLYAPHDHRMRLFGDDGVLEAVEPWDDQGRITLRRYHTLRRKRFLGWREKLRPQGPAETEIRAGRTRLRDFCRGVAEMAGAIRQGREPYIGADFSLHLTELTLACQNAGTGVVMNLTTEFAPMAPLERSAP